MSFLVLLLVLWVEKFSAWRAVVQQDGPWLRLLARAEARIQGQDQPWLALLTVVGIPLLGLALVLTLLAPLAYGWLALPVHLLVLVYSLGRGDLHAALGPFRDSWRRGDGEARDRIGRGQAPWPERSASRPHGHGCRGWR